MKTLVLKVNPKKPELEKIRIAAELLRKGKLVAFPTETVYGLGANAFDEQAVKKIFKAKGRPLDNPIIVHIYSLKQLYEIASKIPEEALLLAKRFWPGPLTIILPKKKSIPDVVTANLKTVAVRMPKHAVARALCKQAALPIAAPSANISGKPSPTSAKHVKEDFYGKIACIIDAGRTNIGLESTVVDLSSKRPVLLRPGGVTAEQLKKILTELEVHAVAKAEKSVSIAKSPGTKYRHYAPEAKLILVEGKKEKALAKAVELAEQHAISGLRTALLLIDVKKDMALENVVVKRFSTKLSAARHLFSALRELDEQGIEIIVVNGIDERGLGLAIMNRLRRACSERIRV